MAVNNNKLNNYKSDIYKQLLSDIAILLLGISQAKTPPHKNLYTNVHSSIIHKGQKVEITQMSIN